MNNLQVAALSIADAYAHHRAKSDETIAEWVNSDDYCGEDLVILIYAAFRHCYSLDALHESARLHSVDEMDLSCDEIEDVDGYTYDERLQDRTEETVDNWLESELDTFEFRVPGMYSILLYLFASNEDEWAHVSSDPRVNPELWSMFSIDDSLHKFIHSLEDVVLSYSEDEWEAMTWRWRNAPQPSWF